MTYSGITVYTENDLMSKNTKVLIRFAEFSAYDGYSLMTFDKDMPAHEPIVISHFPSISLALEINDADIYNAIASGTEHSLAHKIISEIIVDPEVKKRLKHNPELHKELRNGIMKLCGAESGFLGEHSVPKFDDTPKATRHEILNKIPDLRTKVKCPLFGRKIPRGVSSYPCAKKAEVLWYLVQHLNDQHKLSREEIADWLDTLDLDLSFPVEADDGETFKVF
jgi:hypothetical protein